MFRKFSVILYTFTHSQPMSSNTKNTVDVQLLATYGTLRDDDNSGAAWTQGFVKVFFSFYICLNIKIFSNILKDISHATTARVLGYRLFTNPIIPYPFAICTGIL